jgi:MEKHLA domain
VNGGAGPAGDPPWLSAASQAWVTQLLRSHQEAFGGLLWAGAGPGRDPRQAAQELFAAATVVLAHDGSADPRFVYANRAALSLWRRSWGEMVGMPSRLSAASAERGERNIALARARQQGIRSYAGVRVDSRGQRFRVEGARLWTMHDAQGAAIAQAAAFNQWWWL